MKPELFLLNKSLAGD